MSKALLWTLERRCSMHTIKFISNIIKEKINYVFAYLKSAIVEHFGEFCVFSPKCQAALHVTKCYFHDHTKYPNIDDFFDIFPKIEFTLDDNFNFVWEPKDYLYTYGTQKDLYCLPFEKIS